MSENDVKFASASRLPPANHLPWCQPTAAVSFDFYGLLIFGKPDQFPLTFLLPACPKVLQDTIS